MNSVRRAIIGRSERFIIAICCSYSKSFTLRTPRITIFAPRLRAKSTSRPVNSAASTRGSPAMCRTLVLRQSV